MSGGVRIVHLADTPGASATLARWFEDEWAPWYGPEGPGDAARDLALCRHRDELPICLVALGAGDQVMGTVALKSESVGADQHPGPWLAAFLVDNEHRRRGVGTALVEAIEAEARRLGFAAVHTSVENGGTMFERRGWRAVGTAQSLRGGVVVYRRDLGEGASPA
ncbi:MAG: GNAT family N-acetyltransferase [Rhodospirillales bacterium]|nr:GNAT family N-acetyltransferase [Rhodospirillales bacterium]